MSVILTSFAKCTTSTGGSSFLGIEGWYKYLPGTCDKLDFEKYGIGSAWLVLAGVIDILLRISALVAVGFFILGAFKMVFSQGSPEQIKAARSTMVNSLVGLLIAIFSTWFIGFFMGAVFNVS